MIRHIRKPHLQTAFLMGAILVYAFLGSPTPDNPDWPEVIIGLLLACAVGFSGLFSAFRPAPDKPLWHSAGQTLLLYGLAVSTLTGIMNGQDPALILRDVLPFLFMMLPVFLGAYFQERPEQTRFLLFAILMLGLVFTLRGIAEQAHLVSAWLGGGTRGELTYFANAPTILFTALFLGGTALGTLRGNAKGFKPYIRALVFAFLAILACLPAALTAQRASIAYGILFFLTIAGIGLVQSPKRTIVFVFVFTILALPLIDDIRILVDGLSRKTDLVGLNRRAEEWSAIWDSLLGSVWHILFGHGWGGTFPSPAVGEVRVNFSHGLLSSALLKGGMFGLALTAAYIGALIKILVRALKPAPVLMLALLGPVLIDTLLYASFKSLDFGLLLLFIPAAAAMIETERRVLYADRNASPV